MLIVHDGIGVNDSRKFSLSAATMYTLCPDCHTIFRISAEHLSIADGEVRCGQCGNLFVALDYLYDSEADVKAVLEGGGAGLPVGRPEVADSPDSSSQDQVARRLAEKGGRFEAVPWEGEEGISRDDAEIDEFTRLRMEIDADSDGVPWRLLGGSLAILLLSLLIVVQGVYYNRDRLSALQGWRAPMETFCTILQCDLPLQRQPAQIELVDRDIRKHPRVSDGLLVNATIVNRASFAQPYPVLELRFSDLSGNTLAARRFPPDEYLDTPGETESGLVPERPVHISLELLDPGDEAVSFQFEFL